MDFLPWSTFTRHYRAMAFARLAYREILRDIETCLSVQASKLYSMGLLPRSGGALDAGRCERGARLADLRGVGPATVRPRATGVRPRGFGFRPRQYGLCARLDDHRSLSGGLSVGAFRHDQSLPLAKAGGGGQDEHAVGLAR